ncbi:hypothetical protein [Clostridiisalibacter paucivorans]|uniref:hypothetical protein n=1 Tax=Clostridiisalibacter paucivorans TaxID=408753 RepID=UPI00054E2AD1|nr:hypothetical protein [Clostridiisalibacter paucivorans]
MNINKEIFNLISTDVFKSLISSDLVTIGKLNAAINLLIKARIPFDIEYSPGTRREATAAQLTIYINPTTTINITISFEGGGSIFSGFE